MRGLRKAFGGLVAVRDISFDIPRGGIAGLIGPNGSGKTTVLNLITAELRARRRARSCSTGRNMLGRPSFAVCRARIARTFQLVRVLPHMTARENVMLGRMFGSDPTSPAHAAHEADALLERVGLGGATRMLGCAAHLYRPEARGACARARHPAASCCCSTNGWPASTRPSCRSASS